MAAIALLLVCRVPDAAATGSAVRLAQLRYAGGNPLPRASAMRRLAWEVGKRTSILMVDEPLVLAIKDARLFEHPFVYLGGDRGFPLPPPQDIERLRRYLIFGGTLLVDSAEARPAGPFDRSARALIAAVLPDNSLQPIKPAHTLYKSFYLIERAVGRVDIVPTWEGVQRDGRLLVVYSQNDLAGAWARDNFGQWEYNVYPGGERQREMAFRWGINILMYALCTDYKADQVHIPFILKRRRWRPANTPQ